MSLAAATLLWPRESMLRSQIFALHCLPTPGTCSLQTARKALQSLQNTPQAAIARAVTASQFRWIPFGLQTLTSSDCCLCSVGAFFVAQQTTVRCNHVLLAVRPMQEALGQRSIPALSLPS